MVSVEPRRFTAAGLARTQFKIRHESIIAARTVQMEAELLAFGDVADQASALIPGQAVYVEGYLAHRHYRSRQLALYVNQLSLEGNDHGSSSKER